MKNIYFLIFFGFYSSFAYSLPIDQSLLNKANSGDISAQEEIAKYYEFSGHSGEALSWLYKAAENGSGLASGKIAESYDKGLMGLKVNRFEALKWYRKGAELKDSNSLKYMADYLSKSKNSNDQKIALNYYLECGKITKNTTCIIRLGKLKRKIDGNLDPTAMKAFEWAAKLGDPEGYTELASYYENGYIVNKDINKALEYIKDSAQKNEKMALEYLGTAYLYGNKYQLVKDEQKGIEYLERAGSKGNGAAYEILGSYYFTSSATTEALNKSIFYYKKAISLNNLDAAYNLATLYNNNFLKSGYDQYFYKKEIVKLLTSAADGNIVEAQLALARAYENGYYNLSSISKAKHYYNLAAKQDSGEAKLKLKGLR